MGRGGEAADAADASYVTGMHAALRQLLSDLSLSETMDAVPILYGEVWISKTQKGTGVLKVWMVFSSVGLRAEPLISSRSSKWRCT